jgi:hypothetical protein
MGEEERQEVSARMKKYWAGRRTPKEGADLTQTQVPKGVDITLATDVLQ